MFKVPLTALFFLTQAGIDVGDVKSGGQSGGESICFGVVVGLNFDEKTVREGGEVEVQGGVD